MAIHPFTSPPRGCHELIGTLLRRRAHVDVTNKEGQCALHMAVKHDHITSAKALLEAGADPNLRYGSSRQISSLMLASCNVTMTKMLLKYGADAKASDDLGCTALHWVAGCVRPGVIDALVEAGADLEARCGEIIVKEYGVMFEGLTPLHAAAVRVDVENIARLLDNGADMNAKHLDGHTPLHAV